MSTMFSNRRRFLKTAAAVGCAALARTAWAGADRSHHSYAYLMAAATDRSRILNAAAEYVTQPPITITAFPAAQRRWSARFLLAGRLLLAEPERS